MLGKIVAHTTPNIKKKSPRRRPPPHSKISLYQYSYRNIETGDISGYIQPAKLEEDATGRFLGKYWGSGDRLKFIGIACGRGDTEEEAKRAATFRAHEIVRRAVED